MRYILLILLASLTLPVMANEADLANCQAIKDVRKRLQCLQTLKRPDAKVSKAECKRSLKCWSKRYRKQAKSACSRAFALRANSSSFWRQHWNNQDFDKVRWQDRGRGVMVYYEQESTVVLHCTFYPNAPQRVKVRIGSRV